MTLEDGLKIRQERRARVRMIRGRVLGASVALFMAVWMVIAVVLVTGHDPALARKASTSSAVAGTTATAGTSSPGSTDSAGSSGSDDTSGLSSSGTAGSSSSTTAGSSSSGVSSSTGSTGSVSPVTSSQS